MTREEQSVKMGKRLKALREETPLNGKKMSHEKLKEKLKEIYGVEISRDSLMNYEVSDVNHSKFGTNLKMNVEYLNCLSSFYGVSTDYLLGRSDAKQQMRIYKLLVRQLVYPQMLSSRYDLTTASQNGAIYSPLKIS